MRTIIIFILTAALSWYLASMLNIELERKSFGASMETFKKMRIAGINEQGPRPSEKYDVLVLGDSLLEILFDPQEFDQQAAAQGRATQSWNLALRSLLSSDFNRIVTSLEGRGRFDSCIVQIPALHFQKPSPLYSVDQVWPGFGLSTTLNLLNPLSRLNHGLDSSANLWTGPITQKSVPWDQELRGGLRVFDIEGYQMLRQYLTNPALRRQLNRSYNQIMGLSTYRFDETSVDAFAKDTVRLKGICEKVTAIWPLFSPELKDRSVGPDPEELIRLRRYLKKKAGVEILDIPWDEEQIRFLDSQHIDPQERGDVYAWLMRII